MLILSIVTALMVVQDRNATTHRQIPPSSQAAPSFSIAAVDPAATKLLLLRHELGEKHVRVLQTLPLRHEGRTKHFLASGDGRVLFLLARDGTKTSVRPITFRSGRLRVGKTTQVLSQAQSLATTADGKTLFVASDSAVASYSFSKGALMPLTKQPLSENRRGLSVAVSVSPAARFLDLAWADSGLDNSSGWIDRLPLDGGGKIGPRVARFLMAGVPTVAYLSPSDVVAISFPALVRVDSSRLNSPEMLRNGSDDPFNSLVARPELGLGFAASGSGLIYRLGLSERKVALTPVGHAEPQSALWLSSAGLCFARSTERRVYVFTRTASKPVFAFDMPQPNMLLAPVSPSAVS